MKKRKPKQTASEKANRAAPVGNGETANPSGGRSGAAQGAQAQGTAGETVRQWRGISDGETETQFYRRAFEWDAAKLATMGAASWERWKCADMVLCYGFEAAIKGGISFDEVLDRPELLRAVECLINDPPEMAAEFLNPNPNPAQGGACGKDCREWFLATFREWVENDYLKPTGKTTPDRDGRGVIPVWDFPKAGTVAFADLTRARFDMFPICFDLGNTMARQTWAHFITVCGLPEFDKLREWLEHDKESAGRGYVEMPALYESAYSEEQYFDLNTGETNAPKYGGGGIRARALLLSFREYLRKRQAAHGCAPVAPRGKPDAGTVAGRGAADRKPDAAQGAADRDAANLCGAIQDLAQVIQAAKLTGAPAPRTGRNVGKVSARVMAGFFGVSVSTVKNWENHPKRQRPPIVDGMTYTAAIRENGAGAFMFAQRYKDTRRGALKTVGGDNAAAVAEKQAAQRWITKHAAELREQGANLSEWDAK